MSSPEYIYSIRKASNSANRKKFILHLGLTRIAERMERQLPLQRASFENNSLKPKTFNDTSKWNEMRDIFLDFGKDFPKGELDNNFNPAMFRESKSYIYSLGDYMNKLQHRYKSLYLYDECKMIGRKFVEIFCSFFTHHLASSKII